MSGISSFFYNNMSDYMFKRNKMAQEREAHDKAVADIKKKYNMGAITKEQFDADMQKLNTPTGNIGKSVNTVNTTGITSALGKQLRDNSIFGPSAQALAEENKTHTAQVARIKNTNSDAAITAAKTKYAKTKADLQEKLNNGTITQEQYDEQLSKADAAFKNATGMPYKTEAFLNKLGTNSASTNSDAAITAAKTKYEKTKAELQEKLNNETITQEQYNEQLAKADKDFENATGMSYKKAVFLDKLGTNSASAVANAVSKASDAYTNVSNGAAFGSMSNVGVSPDGVSTGLRAQAQENVRQAGDEQRNMQQNFQIANRDPLVEAGRAAIAEGALRGVQKVNAAPAATSLAEAYLDREVVPLDTPFYVNRQDTQRKEGVENQRQMHAAQQEAIRRNTNANNYDYVTADAARYNRAVGALSNNNDKTDGSDKTKDKTDGSGETKDTTPAVQDPLQGCTSADLRNLQSLFANEYTKSDHPQTGDGNPETGDYKFYTSTNADTNAELKDVGVTFDELKSTNAAYVQRLINIYNSLKRMVTNPQIRTAMFNSAKANARVEENGSLYTVGRVTNESEISDAELLRDYISGKENATTRAQGGATAADARRRGTVTNRDDINMNENVVNALSSNMRQ